MNHVKVGDQTGSGMRLMAQDGQVDSDLKGMLIEAFRWLDPGAHSTHLVSDRSGWWRDPQILWRLGPALGSLYPGSRPTVVAAPEVTGFLLGPLVAGALRVGFVEAYKADRDRRVVDPMAWGRSRPDYRGHVAGLGVRAGRVGAGDRVLMVDDWVDTGAQLEALQAALVAAGADVIGAAVIVDDRDTTASDEPRIRSLLRGTDFPI
jgi:adenine phosphoribosyltransferase